MASDFQIGTTPETLTALDALATPVPDPQWEFQKYRKMARLADGSMRGQGPSTIVWSFPLAEDDQIAQLEAYKSTETIYIRACKRDGTFAVFEVTMNWTDPRQDGDHMNGFVGYRSGLSIEFLAWAEVV